MGIFDRLRNPNALRGASTGALLGGLIAGEPQTAIGASGMLGNLASDIEMGRQRDDVESRRAFESQMQRFTDIALNLPPEQRTEFTKNFVKAHPDFLKAGIAEIKGIAGLPGPTAPTPELGKYKVILAQKYAAAKTPEERAAVQSEIDALGMVDKGGVTVNVGGSPAPTTERQEILKLGDFARKLDEIGTLFDESYVGPIQGRVATIKEKYVGAPENQVIFNQKINSLADDLLRLRSGNQINEMELQRMLTFLPTTNLPATTVRSRLKAIQQEVARSIKERESSLIQSGFIPVTQSPDALGAIQPEGGTQDIRTAPTITPEQAREELRRRGKL